MKQSRTIKNYFKKKLYKGRNLFARAVDFFALRAVALIALYLWFISIMENTVIAWLLSVCALITASIAAELYKSIRLDRFTVRERKRMREDVFRKQLHMIDEDEYVSLVNDIASDAGFDNTVLTLPIQQIAEISADTVLNCHRRAVREGYKKAVIFSASQPSEAAIALIKRHCEMNVSIAPVSMFYAAAERHSLYATDEQIDAMILDDHEKLQKKRKNAESEPFKSTRTRRYILVAVVLFAASFFVANALYYRLLAAACASFAGISWWLSATEEARGAKQE